MCNANSKIRSIRITCRKKELLLFQKLFQHAKAQKHEYYGARNKITTFRVLEGGFYGDFLNQKRISKTKLTLLDRRVLWNLKENKARGQTTLSLAFTAIWHHFYK